MGQFGLKSKFVLFGYRDPKLLVIGQNDLFHKNHTKAKDPNDHCPVCSYY